MQLLKKVAFPLVLIGAILTLYLIWLVLDLPPESELMAIAQDYYNRYGLLTVFISAIVEGLILVGMYYPGSDFFGCDFCRKRCNKSRSSGGSGGYGDRAGLYH